MVLKSRLKIMKTFMLSLTMAVFLPLGVHAQTDFPLSSIASEQIEYEAEKDGEYKFNDFADELVGRSATNIDIRAESEARSKIHEGLKQHLDAIDVRSYQLTVNEARALLQDVIYWDGSLFYAKYDGIGVQYVEGGYVTYIFPSYIEHEEEVEKALKKAIRESITSDMSDLQKMLALHDWLATHCSYDYSLERSSVYDALVVGSAVCQGYKDAYEVLLRYVGILEVGTASGGNHTWNQVKIDGQWYNVDVTWDSNAIENRPLGQMYYGNFIGSDTKFKLGGHTFESQDHECTSTLYDEDAWWNAGGAKVYSPVMPINGTGSYRIGYDDSNMSLIYRAETTGAEKVVHVFSNAIWGYTSGSQSFYYTDCFGVLQHTDRATLVNDAKSVYRITNDGNFSTIYTYDGTDGRNIFGIRVRNGKLEVQIGYDPVISKSEIKTISLESDIEKDPQVMKIEDFVKRMYRITLGREAGADEVKYYVDRLQSGEMDGSAVAQGFVLSKEFQGKNLNADDYVVALYSTFFDRVPDLAEVQYWKDELTAGMSRKYVLRGFVNSDEFESLCRDAGINRGLMVLAEGEEYEIDLEKLGAFVERLYEKALKREAEPDGKQYYVQLISTRQITPEQAAKNFFFSPEFEGFRTSNAEYIERLYQTFMGRSAEAAGMSYWLNEMSKGMSREVVLSRFAASDEFKNIMKGFGIR